MGSAGCRRRFFAPHNGFWCILEADVQPQGRTGLHTVTRARAGFARNCPAQAASARPTRQKSFRTKILEGRPGTDQSPTVGQGLRMQGNGRLTAPPQFEAVLVTNSVGCRSLGEWNLRSKARGTSLAQVSGNSSRRCIPQGQGRTLAGERQLRKASPVSVAHSLSASQGAAESA